MNSNNGIWRPVVRTLKAILHDFTDVYEAVIQNDEYSDVTKEQVQHYYNS